MTCFMCKGHLEDKETTFMADLGTCIIIIKHVPSQVCSQCGETSYSNETAKKLEQIVNTLRTSFAAEIAVVNFSSEVA